MPETRKLNPVERVVLGALGLGFTAASGVMGAVTFGMSKTITGTGLTDYDKSSSAMLDAAISGEIEVDDDPNFDPGSYF